MPQQPANLPPESGEEIEAALAQPWYRPRFRSRLERRFESDSTATRSSHVAFALLFIAAVNLFVLLPDAQISHAQLMRGLVLRLGLTTPLLLFAAWFIRRPLPVWMQGLVAIVPYLISIAADSWLGLFSSGQTADRYFTGIGMGIFLNNLIMPLRIRHAILAALLGLIVYDGFLCGAFGPSPILESRQVAMNMTLFAAISVVFRWRNEILYRRAFLLTAHDLLHVQQLAWANRQLTELSYTDSLTLLPNRRYLDEMLVKTWNAACQSGEPITLMMIDVDHFKSFNDTHGHAAGDTCLQRIAHALQFSVRSEVDILARYGGEEFVIILPGASLTQALGVSERITEAIAALEMPHPSSPDEKFITVSNGVVVCSPGGGITLPEQLLAMADEALYTAKARGRNRVVARQMTPQALDSGASSSLTTEPCI